MRILVAALLVGVVMLPVATAQQAPVVSGRGHAGLAAVLLGTLGGTTSVPTDINVRGQVIGTSQTSAGETHAFLWEKGVMIDLAPGFGASEAFDINNRGQVVLQRSVDGTQPSESLVWSRKGETSLGTVNARFINERGQVAGTVFTDDGPVGAHTNPFLWSKGQRVDMGPIPNWGSDSSVVDLNDRGAILGQGLSPESSQSGFVWADGRIEPVGDPAAFGGNGVVDLNNRGRVVGSDYEAGAFVWKSGVLTPLRVPAGVDSLEPAALNDRGQVVGTSLAADEAPDRAFLWREGVFTDIAAPDAVATGATAVNDAGQVVGRLGSSAFLWHKGRLTDLGRGLEGAVQATQISGRGSVIGTLTSAGGETVAVVWPDRGRRH